MTDHTNDQLTEVHPIPIKPPVDDDIDHISRSFSRADWNQIADAVRDSLLPLDQRIRLLGRLLDRLS